ncbi:MAG TPA: LacI family DNA-binding transcriptional regulator [Treponemataceae bacterium]|nr:LacI family DNA-binding transcriptional regulator [Treponemataceae bacterium]
MTVIEIAKRAGVSIGTVDRVLHNRGRVSTETREKIQKIIDEEGYQPNPLARHLKRNRDYKIGVIIPELRKESSYWQLLYNGILKAVEELSPFSFSIQLFEFNRPIVDSFLAAFNEMLEARCNAWIIAPVMQEETLGVLTNLEKPVPYVFIDSPLPLAKPVTTVAQNPFQGGYAAGRVMDLISHSSGPFAVIRPFTEAFNLNERARGFIKWFSNRKEIKIIDVVCPEHQMQETLLILEKTMKENPDLKGVFVVSAMVHKIAEFFETHYVGSKITVIGYDLVPLNCAMLKEDKIDCLISQRPEEQGRLVLQQLYKTLVLEEETDKQIEMPIDIYFKENLQL